ncbi:SRPBCC family protein [Pseudonocardia sp. HH130630-07]|uniref:SRPBCC family protein n=1 Tax=Pseudonocardia sp. HH130630-07 TaxID=1690815 RepID=UPI00081539F3|nr:SRPBCC family protein [Pseudonocardia sp. HH130630-07]ANY07497.1 polyketide cyclase [Pseudonocardia sp. HH130630-07]
MDRAELRVDAPADAVWALVSDVTRAGEWSPEATGGQWRDGAAGPAVGARFVGGNRRGRIRWSTHCRVTECEPPHRFTFVVTESRTAWGWVLTPADDHAGTHVVAWRENVGRTSLPVRLLQRSGLLGRDREALMRSGLQHSLERVKSLVEDGPANGTTG